MPRYIVQMPDGEMEYGSIEQLRKAVEIGLVSPDALVNEEGGFYGRPASRVVTRPGSGVRSAQRAIPIPSPHPSYALFALALPALFLAEAPRLAITFPQLSKLPGMTWLAEHLVEAAGWSLPLGPVSLPIGPAPLATVLLFAVFARGLFAAAPQNAVLFGALGAWFLRTERLEPALACFAAAAAVIALGVRRLLKRRAPLKATATR